MNTPFAGFRVPKDGADDAQARKALVNALHTGILVRAVHASVS
jgi:hypothetical protein